MLSVIENREVTTSGTLETNTFSIKANGKAFKVLIDGLYSDKIKAVTRELWTNAFDSHAEAGTPDMAFDCHIPTVYEPYFSVRDYGVSMSHNDLMTLYTTVFHSTKENTNTQVGKLGLGSKSPFAYTDTFTVTAWRNGQKRVYSAYIGEDYIPRISLMTEEATDEPTGLEVSFPVKRTDCGDFRAKAELLGIGFTPRPNVPGIHFDEEVVLYSGTGWKLVDSYGARAQAKQGCVLYPLDPYAVVGASDEQRSLLQAGFVIDFPIGELEITANRESLGYDKPTCANILSRLETIERELLTQISAMLDGCKTLWEARATVRSMKRGAIPECAHKLLKNIRWRGKTMKENIILSIDKRDIGSVHIDTYQRTYFTSRRNKSYYVTTGNVHNLHPSNLVFVFHDTSSPVTKAEQRMAHLYSEGKFRAANSIVVIRGRAGSRAIKRVLVNLGRPSEFIRLNDVVLPPTVKGVRNHKVKAKLLNGCGGRNTTEVDLTVGPDDTIYYVAAERTNVIGAKPSVTHTFYEANDIFVKAKKCGLIPNDAKGYIIPASLKRMIKGDNFVSIVKLAQDHLDANFDIEKVKEYRETEAIISNSGKWGQLLVKIIENNLSGFINDQVSPAGNSIGEYAGAITEYLTGKAKLEALIELNYAVTTQLYTVSSYNSYIGITEPDDFDVRYPMLNHLLHAVGGCKINEHFAKMAIDYINLVDTNNASGVQIDGEIDIAA